MKKIFSLFAAALVALSMTAAPAVSQLAVKKLEAKQHVTLLAKQTTEVMALDKKVEKSVARKSAHEATDSNNAISLSFDPTQSVINVTTTNNDTYFYVLFSNAMYTEIGGQDYSTASLLNVVSSVLITLDRVNYTQYFVTSGNNVIYPEEDYLWNDGLVAGSNYIAIAVPYAAGAINGTPVYTTFTYVAPATPTSYTNITVNNANLYKAYLSSHGILDVYGWNSDSTAYAEFMYHVNNATTGDYTAMTPDDVYNGYIALVNGTDTTNIDIRQYFDFQVATDDDINYILNCHALGKDGNGYNVSMSFSNIIVPADTIQYTMTRNAKWSDYAASQGWFQLYQNDGHYNVSISTANSPLTEGEFLMADLDASYTYIQIDGTKVVPSNLHAILSKNGNVVTGTLWVTDNATGDVYEATLTHDPSLPIGLDYDSYEGVEMTFATSDITANTASGNSKKTITFRAKNADDEAISLTLYASEEDADIVIPEGVYTLASTKAAGTALISTGVSSTGSVSTCYAATVDEDGYLDDLWFLKEGTITVEKVNIDGAPALYMEIMASNSWGFDVNITVGSNPATALENTNAEVKATKVIENGQVIIIRDGVRYNVLGAQE